MTKEEKAREHANRSQFKSDFPHDWDSDYSGFIAGYEAAENDARERAVWALKMTCDQYDDGLEMCWEDHSKCSLHCPRGLQFLTYYDNE